MAVKKTAEPKVYIVETPVKDYCGVGAGGVHFARGNYTGTIVLATTKKLLIDAQTQFNRQIQCDSVMVVGAVTAPIADFYFTGHDVEAHSSWFSTIMGFVNCNARYLVIGFSNCGAGEDS